MKSIVIYFSRADENYFGGQIRNISKGNTEVIVDYIKEIAHADTFKVVRQKPYSKNYRECTEDAKKEQQNSERPELVNFLDNIDNYDVIFIGTPLYWDTLAQPMFTQLEKLNFNGKIIMPFVTHEGGGFGNVINDIKRIAKGAIVKSGLEIVGSTVNSAKPRVENWIRNNLGK